MAYTHRRIGASLLGGSGLLGVMVRGRRRPHRAPKVTISKRLAFTVICGLMLGCSPTNPTPSPSPTSPYPAVLTIDGRDNPPVIIEIGTFEVARIACSAGGTVTPGDHGAPALPWDLRIVQQSNGQVLLSSRVTDLPKWVVMFGKDAGIGSFPGAGPPGPSCAP
jgi:hypothetical protein